MTPLFSVWITNEDFFTRERGLFVSLGFLPRPGFTVPEGEFYMRHYWRFAFVKGKFLLNG